MDRIIPNNTHQHAIRRGSCQGKAGAQTFLLYFMHFSKVILTAADNSFGSLPEVQ